MTEGLCESGMMGKLVAVQFGISPTAVYGIKNRTDRWLHVR